MGVLKLAVSSAVVALVAGHQLAVMEPARRGALWASARTLLGASAAAAPTPPELPATPLPRVLPASLPATGMGEETVAPDRFGQFQTSVEIGGQRLSVLVDTGATTVALSYEDADRLGIRPPPSDFRYAVSTANGRALVAKVTLPSVRLGAIEVRDVPALVGGRGQLGQTLLGMSFLSRLSIVRVDHGRMVLAR